MHDECGNKVETSVEARAGFLDRPVLLVLMVLLMAGRDGDSVKIAFSALASEMSPMGVEVAWAFT